MKKQVTRVSLDYKTTEDAMDFWENYKKQNPESTWKAIGLKVCHIYKPYFDDVAVKYMASIGDKLDQKEG